MKKSYKENTLPADQTPMRKEAAVHFRMAIDIYPTFFNATYDLGRTYQILGEADSAIVFYEKAFTLDSTFTLAATGAADLLIQQNRISEAKIFYEKAISITPKEYSNYDKLSYALFMKKDYPDAISTLRAAISNFPQLPQPYVNLARIYHTINQDDSAKYLLREALKVSPEHQEAKGFLQSLGN
jgi:tetratricopeptide (TPR) repeat protein